ncbi:MAG: diaminobutyrate acetyltransferase [Acidimicrobiia bacterium]|nr:diaminobutyrate acetyltransferase [Acidimicrobiia bacterium]
MRRDAAEMWRLARKSVDPNSPYSYLMLEEYFSDTCAVAELDDEMVGFVTGFRPFSHPETLFIWQIAVDESTQGMGIAGQLLDHVVKRPHVPRLRYLEATVTPSNEQSIRLFRGFARRWETECVEEELFADSDFPDDTSDNHEAEVRFRIGAL